MLSIENIPDEVLELVLQKFLLNKGDTLDSFKHDLLYLTICSRWRRLSKCIVFSHAAIVYEEIEKDDMVDEATAHLPNEGDVETNAKLVKLASNLNLIYAAGCSALISHIDIRIDWWGNIFAGLTKVMELLENASALYQVKHLAIDLYSRTPIKNTNNDIDNAMVKITSISQKFFKCMPQIKHLKVRNNPTDPTIHRLYGQIVEHYVHQLVELSCWGCIEIAQQCAFAQLEHADIEINHIGDVSIPTICAEKLKTLRIRGTTVMQFLELFALSDSSTDIEFHKLQKLSISCLAEAYENVVPSNIDRDTFTLVLPKLSRLEVYMPDKEYYHLIINHMVLPAFIDSINILAHNSMYKSIRNISLPAANKVKLGSSFSATNPRVVHNMDQTFSRFTNCQSASMTIASYSIPINAKDITCTKLKFLHIDPPTNISSLISLLEKLPNLNELIVNEVTLNDSCKEINIPGIRVHEQHPMVPFNTSLEKMKLSYDEDDYSNIEMLPVFLYFLLRLPKLQRFTISQISEDILPVLLEHYKPFYPHISSVKLDLGTSIFHV